MENNESSTDREYLKAIAESLKKIEESVAKPKKKDWAAYVPLWGALIAAAISVWLHFAKSYSDSEQASKKTEFDYLISAFDKEKSTAETVSTLNLLMKTDLISDSMKLKINGMLANSMVLSNGEIVFLDQFTETGDAMLLYEWGYEISGNGPVETTYARNLKALRLIHQAIKIDSTKFFLYVAEGDAYFNLDMYDEAVKSYSNVLRLRNSNSWAYYRRGWCYHKTGNDDKACADFRVAVENSLEADDVNKWSKDALTNDWCK